MGGEELKFVNEAFESNWLAPYGPHIDFFEKELAAYVGAKYAVALSSGTAAIHLCLKSFGVKQGDLVFCSSLTFAGSCFPIAYENAIPVFIDSEPDTWNMSPDALENAMKWALSIGKKPKAVIVVNIYGNSAKWNELKSICSVYDVPIIEDAAESLGSIYMGKQTGTFGDLGVFSFNGNKILTTTGGGMVITNDEITAQKMKFWSTQSRENFVHYEHNEVGYNYRMSNICAGIGRGQLQVLDLRISQKKSVFKNYCAAFTGTSLVAMPQSKDSNTWLSVFTVEKNSPVTSTKIVDVLQQNAIEARPVWKPMHLQPVYAGCKYFMHSNESISEDLFNRGLCLPSGTAMSIAEQQMVIDLVLHTLKECK